MGISVFKKGEYLPMQSIVKDRGICLEYAVLMGGFGLKPDTNSCVVGGDRDGISGNPCG